MSGLSGVKTQFQQLWTDLQGITKTAVGSMSDEVKQGFADMKDSIGELSSQTSSLGNAIRSLGDTFNSDFLKSLGNGISRVGDTVNTVTGLVDKLGAMKNTIGNLGSTLQNLGNVLGSENGGGLLSNIGSFLSKIGSADGGQIVSNFGNLISRADLQNGWSGRGNLRHHLEAGKPWFQRWGNPVESGRAAFRCSVEDRRLRRQSFRHRIVYRFFAGRYCRYSRHNAFRSARFCGYDRIWFGGRCGYGSCRRSKLRRWFPRIRRHSTCWPGGSCRYRSGSRWRHRSWTDRSLEKLRWLPGGSHKYLEQGYFGVFQGRVGHQERYLQCSICYWQCGIVHLGRYQECGFLGSQLGQGHRWRYRRRYQEGMGWVGSAVKSVAKGIRSFLHFSVPDEGPLSDADTYMPDFMKLLTGGIKKGEGGLISQIKSMAAKVQQGIEGISSFSLPELTLPHFDGSGWNFPQAALAGGGTTRTTNLGGVYITVNGYNARNDDELAQTVADKINGMIHEDDSVFK